MPPAAAVLMLSERSITSRSSGTRQSPGTRPVSPTIGPGRPASAAAVCSSAVAHNGAPARPPVRGLDHDTAGSSPAETVATLRTWAQAQGMDPLALHCDQVISASPVGGWHALPGPTGEANLYAVQARPAVLCLADDDADRLAQLAAVLAVGSRAVWPLQTRPLLERLPPALREQIALAQDWQQTTVHFDAVLQHGDATALLLSLIHI